MKATVVLMATLAATAFVLAACAAAPNTASGPTAAQLGAGLASGTPTPYQWGSPQTSTPYPWQGQQISPQGEPLISTLSARESAVSPLWDTYQDARYGFSFRIPPGSSIAFQSDNSGRVYLPVTAGTNLAEKRLDVSVVEGANPCRHPGGTPPDASSQYVSFNGIRFLEETWGEGAAGSAFDVTSYSTVRGTACVNLTFTLHSHNAESFTPPLPEFDVAAESAIFSEIVSSYTTP